MYISPGFSFQGSGSGSEFFYQGSGSGSGFPNEGSGSGSGFPNEGSGSGSGFPNEGSGSGFSYEGSGSGSGFPYDSSTMGPIGQIYPASIEYYNTAYNKIIYLTGKHFLYLNIFIHIQDYYQHLFSARKRSGVFAYKQYTKSLFGFRD